MGLFSKKPVVEEKQEELISPKTLDEIGSGQIARLEAEDGKEIQTATEEHEIVNTFVDEMGIIAAGTVIRGNIKTKGHLAISGVVEGGIVADGNVMLTGVVKGEITCNNIIIESTDYCNSIKAKGSVSIKANTTVSGPIFCKHISVNGTVIGPIKATGNVGLTKDSHVRGDVTAAVLAVEPGAKISGSVTVK